MPLIVFDLDGTLVDSQRDLAESANDMLAHYGAPPLAVSDVAAMVGDGARQLVARALAAASVNADPSTALEKFLSFYSRRLLVHTKPYARIPETVRVLSERATLAVLTNKPEALSRRLLEHFDLSRHFAWVIGGDSGFARKPDPAALSYLIRSAAVGPSSSIMIGDSMVDVETARGAGSHVCVASYGFGHLRRPIETRDNELIAHRPEDLLRLLSELWPTSLQPRS